MEINGVTFESLTEQLEKKDPNINSNEYSKYFVMLSQSDQSVPVFLNYIETSVKAVVLFAATKGLQIYVIEHWQNMDPEIGENIFRVTQNRVNSDPSIKDSICYYQLLKLMGLVIADNIDMIDVYTEYSPDQLVIIFNTIFERVKENGCTNRALIQRKMNEIVDVVLEVLNNSQMNQDWFSLLSASTSITPDFDVYFQFLGRLGEACSIPSCIPGLLSFYEEIIESEYLNIGPESCQFVETFLAMILEFTDSILEDENMHSYVYFVWSKLVLYNPRFFGDLSRMEFTQNFFAKFSRVLTSFIGQPDDFFYFIDNTSHMFYDWAQVIDQEMIDYRPFLVNFIQFLKDCIEEDPETFTNEAMEIVIHRLSKIRTNIIGQIYISLLKSDSASAFYFIGNSSKKIRQIFSQPCSKRLIENPPPAYAGICWIKNCVKYCKDLLPQMIHLLFQYSDDDLKPATECIKELSLEFPTYFTDIIDELMDSLDDIPLESGADIICTLLNSIPYSKDDYYERFYDILRDISTSIEDLAVYIDFFVSLIEGTVLNTHPERFYELARDAFTILLEPLKQTLLEDNDRDQNLLCRAILSSYENKWISADENILLWLDSAIFICAVPGHFEILKYFTDFMPYGDVFEFITENCLSVDAELLEAILHFLGEGLLRNTFVFVETFTLPFFFQFLQNNSSKVVEATLICIKEIIDNNVIDETVKQLLELLAIGLINFFWSDSINICLQILLELGQKVFTTSFVAQFILSKLPYRSERADIFAYHFALPEPHIEDIIIAGHEMIALYRQRTPTDE